MSLLKKIHEQPDHIRELWAVFCTLIVAVIIAAVWFYSFKQNVYALLNPDQEVQSQNQSFAGNTKSLFDSFGQIIKDSTAQISQVLGIIRGSSQTTQVEVNNSSSGVVHILPVSGNR